MKYKLFFICFVAISLIQFACKKNNGNGSPIITDVRSVDPAKQNVFFVKAMPGNIIVIQGANLDGLQAVYFNDTAAYFNPTYATASNIIVTIPITSQTVATNLNVTNLIKVVTNHGTVTYSFTLTLPPPIISSIVFDNSGKTVYINGVNFQGVKKITFPVPGTNDTATSFTINKTYTQIAAVIPPGIAFVDSVRVNCTFGAAAFAYPPPMFINSVSNENATAGATITLNGSNFLGISNVVFPGGIAGSNLHILSVTQLTVTVPSGIIAPDSIRIQGVLGTAVSPQLFDSYITHPSPGYLSTFDSKWAYDNTSYVGWTGGFIDAPTAATNYPGGNGSAGFLQQPSVMGANSGGTSLGAAGILQLNDVPWVSNTATSINNYSMKFEVNVTTPWSAGEIWISVGDWYTWNNYAARYAPWSTAVGGTYKTSGWTTVTIPLTQFLSGNAFYKTSYNSATAPASLFTDYLTTGVAFMIVNDQGIAVPANSLNVAIDNVRIVQGK